MSGCRDKKVHNGDGPDILGRMANLITQHLLDLNVKLQGKHQLVNKMYEHISSFEKKLQLFKTQLNRITLTHFPTLALRKAELADFDGSKYAENVDKLCTEFTIYRFTDLMISENVKRILSCFLNHLILYQRTVLRAVKWS